MVITRGFLLVLIRKNHVFTENEQSNFVVRGRVVWRKKLWARGRPAGTIYGTTIFAQLVQKKTSQSLKSLLVWLDRSDFKKHLTELYALRIRRLYLCTEKTKCILDWVQPLNLATDNAMIQWYIYCKCLSSILLFVGIHFSQIVVALSSYFMAVPSQKWNRVSDIPLSTLIIAYSVQLLCPVSVSLQRISHYMRSLIIMHWVFVTYSCNNPLSTSVK